MTRVRKWWLMPDVTTLSAEYHWLDRARRRTACGVKLPQVFEVFVSAADDTKAQREKRCEACQAAPKPRAKPAAQPAPSVQCHNCGRNNAAPKPSSRLVSKVIWFCLCGQQLMYRGAA